MITAVQGYTNFCGIKKTKPQKIIKKIVNINNSIPNGITQTPIRFNTEDNMRSIVAPTVGLLIIPASYACVNGLSSGFSQGFNAVL